VRRKLGDVLIAWENEALLTVNETSTDGLEIVIPSLSILAEPPVALVDKVVDKRRTREPAQAYLEFLYSPEGQELAAKHYFRPRLNEIAARHADRFAKVELFTVDEVFGGWAKAQKTHFANGGVFDQIYQPGS
jgi:sulfate transport system substrate-binding protein